MNAKFFDSYLLAHGIEMSTEYDYWSGKIIEKLDVGSPLSIACHAVGIPYAVIMEWIEIGFGLEGDAHKELFLFAERLVKAMAELDIAATKIITSSMHGKNPSMKTLTWLMERANPAVFGESVAKGHGGGERIIVNFNMPHHDDRDDSDPGDKIICDD